MPAAVAWPELSSGSKDSQWIEVKGVARSLDVREGRLFLEIAADGGQFEAMFPGVWSEPPPFRLIDAEVSVRGACGTVFNQRRQLIGIALHVPGLDFVTTETSAPADPFSLPSHSLVGLLQFSAKDKLDHRVHVQGVVTLKMFTAPTNSTRAAPALGTAATRHKATKRSILIVFPP